MRLRREAEFQTSVNRVAELPHLRVRLSALHRNGVLKIAAVLHLERFGAFQRVPLALIDAVCTNWQLHVFREGIVERDIVISHDDPVAVAVIVNLHFEYLFILVAVYYHKSELFLPKIDEERLSPSVWCKCLPRSRKTTRNNVTQ